MYTAFYIIIKIYIRQVFTDTTNLPLQSFIRYVYTSYQSFYIFRFMLFVCTSVRCLCLCGSFALFSRSSAEISRGSACFMVCVPHYRYFLCNDDLSYILSSLILIFQYSCPQTHKLCFILVN